VVRVVEFASSECFFTQGWKSQISAPTGSSSPLLGVGSERILRWSAKSLWASWCVTSWKLTKEVSLAALVNQWMDVPHVFLLRFVFLAVVSLVKVVNDSGKAVVAEVTCSASCLMKRLKAPGSVCTSGGGPGLQNQWGV